MVSSDVYRFSRSSYLSIGTHTDPFKWESFLSNRGHILLCHVVCYVLWKNMVFRLNYLCFSSFVDWVDDDKSSFHPKNTGDSHAYCFCKLYANSHDGCFSTSIGEGNRKSWIHFESTDGHWGARVRDLDVNEGWKTIDHDPWDILLLILLKDSGVIPR